MKIAMIIVRTLMGLMFLFASVVVLFKIDMGKMPEMSEANKTFMAGIMASGYLLTFIKVTELVCSIAFLTGRFVTLAAVVIFPIIINILLTHIFVAPSGIPTAALLLIGDLFLAYYYRKNYVSLFAVK
ncbi:DoxX family membrane protein [Mucilaginibacter sp.]|jgi:putative oxidoreductase|uniref:DoxX family membrane protein n=1 Tax=Mucilaginibacter sp. TaxID=1882438 RepID=UPI0026086526|nr:DoxX family membrane protein [Mucilaginibacter sp.]MDB5127878.1 DoxX protein [Mucilaginibacter sp.]